MFENGWCFFQLNQTAHERWKYWVQKEIIHTYTRFIFQATSGNISSFELKKGQMGLQIKTDIILLDFQIKRLSMKWSS